MADPGTLEEPFSQPPGPRRDCLPHRSNWLELLAWLTVVFASVAFCLWLPAAVAFALGLTTLRMAHRDVKEMACGVRDPQGQEQAFRAIYRANFGMALSVFAFGACPFLWMLMAVALAMSRL